MQNKNRIIDRTYLSLDAAEERGLIHRDYIAHCFRWSHVIKFLNKEHRYKDAIMLDVGCGKEMPLAKTMYVNKMTPKAYVGVDANKFSIPEMLTGKKIPINLWSETDFCDLDQADVQFNSTYLPNILTCFEVLEHVTPGHCRRMLEHFQALTSEDCNYFISTPCYNGSAAGNHINEMTFEALGGLIEDLNFKIIGAYGTFASISDYVGELSAVAVYEKGKDTPISYTDLRPIFNALRNYYDTNALSVIFAPLFPAHSRNCLWHLTKKKGDSFLQQRLFSELQTVNIPWSQHPDWIELSGFTHKHSDECLDRVGSDLVGNTLKCGKEGIWIK